MTTIFPGQSTGQGRTTRRGVGSNPFSVAAKPKKKAPRMSAIGNDVKGLKKNMREVKKKLEHSLSSLVFRGCTTGQLLTTYNLKQFIDVPLNSLALTEQALATARFFDPSNPSVPISGSLVSGTYERDLLVKTYSKITIRNNYQTPCRMSAYVCVPKEDTSVSPSTALTNGLLDQGNPSPTSPFVYLTDSAQFRGKWKILKSKTKTMNGGDEVHLTYGAKEYNYSPALADAHALAYQSKYQGAVLVIAITGCICHDGTTSSLHALQQAGVDFFVEYKWETSYDSGGADFSDIVVDASNLDTIVTTGFTTNKPVADNLGYSQS